jgi:tRNA(Ser,Leu) C12 N-acetylase TAN1
VREKNLILGLVGAYMVDALEPEIAKLVITSRGLEPTRQLRFALRTAIRGARVRSAGFKGIFILEAAGEVFDLARLVYDECSQRIGHVTAVLATVGSREEPIKEAAVRIAVAQIGSEESFSFRLHKRGAHGLERDTSTLEREIGGAIWSALEGKYNKKPKVNLKSPDVTVVVEVLGPIAAIGISRRVWRESAQAA